MILHTRLPGEPPLVSELFEVTSVECRDPFDYWAALNAVWGTDEQIAIVEHDMECNDGLLHRLVTHPRPLVTYAYTLHWASTHRPAAFAQRRGDFPAGNRYLGMPIGTGDAGADFSGLGFCKIEASARVRPLRRTSWQFLDTAVDAAIDGRWRVLWPEVEHHHV